MPRDSLHKTAHQRARDLEQVERQKVYDRCRVGWGRYYQCEECWQRVTIEYFSIAHEPDRGMGGTTTVYSGDKDAPPPRLRGLCRKCHGPEPRSKWRGDGMES